LGNPELGHELTARAVLAFRKAKSQPVFMSDKQTGFFLVLALAWSSVLTGCSTTSPIAGTKVIGNSAQALSLVEENALTALGARLSVRVGADSWISLIKKVKPTFAWNGRDMMWIEKDTNGQPKFVMDEAYLYRPANQPHRWVLLDAHDAPFDQCYTKVMGYTLHGVATLRTGKPVPEGDAGVIGDYAVAKSTHPRFGVVYEIGWQRLMANGTGLARCNRQIYVFEDRKSHWHFLGEGPEEGSEHGGGSTVESRVIWAKSGTMEPPLRIQFDCRNVESEARDDPDFVPRPEFVTYHEAVLTGTFPARLHQISSRSYLLAGNGDTLDKIVAHCASWRPIYMYRIDGEGIESSTEKTLEKWLAELVRLNPQLPKTRDIKEGTRIEMPTAQEIRRAL
jgi:hypothetical protein